MTFFRKIFPLLSPTISDDFFLVIDRFFLSFAWSLVSDILIYNVKIMTLFFTKTSISDKKFSSLHLFSVCSYFATLPTTLLHQIVGGRMHRPSPTSNFWGTVSPKSPPMAGPRMRVEPANRPRRQLTWMSRISDHAAGFFDRVERRQPTAFSNTVTVSTSGGR